MITPEIHAWLLGAAALASLVLRGMVLVRHPDSAAARCHAWFGLVVAWWFFCTAEIAVATTDHQVALFSRLAHIAIGFLPAVVFQLHVTTAGLQDSRRSAIKAHYAGSVAVTLFCLLSPDLFAAPRLFEWGYYPAYTVWGVVPVGYLLIVLVEVPLLYRARLRAHPPGSVARARARALYHANIMSPAALVDFLVAFGLPVYPFGYGVLLIMHIATLVAVIRYHFVEVTPEIAAAEIVATIPDALLVVDVDGIIRVHNAAALAMFGGEATSLAGRRVVSLAEGTELHKVFGAPLRERSPSQEIEFVEASGIARQLNVTSTVLEHGGVPLAKIFLLRDVTELRAAMAENAKLEDWVRQQQKLETLGVMAGGVAHDFNNLLMGILGTVESTREKPASLPLADDLRIIATAAQRASELTRQLLTYAGRDRAVRSAVEINAVVSEISELMLTAISKKAKLQLQTAEGALWVLADAAQIRQVVLNLVTNASEALELKSGTINLRTGVLDDPPFLPPELRQAQGGWVFVEVEDDGKGMDAATLKRMFEPFFTTKFTGRGLGLAMVAGIVRAHDGFIDVDSNPGFGTRVTIVLPMTTAPTMEQPADDLNGDWHAEGLVLLADDDPVVRHVVREMLESIGFDVVEAIDGKQAVKVFRAQTKPIRLMVLDRTMPEMSGAEAYASICATAGVIPTVFVSGYTVDGTDADPGTASIPKPFTRQMLIGAARKVTGRTGAAQRVSQ